MNVRIKIFVILALLFPLIKNKVKAITSSPEFRHCDFSSPEIVYNITDLLQCMNDLASMAVSRSRIGRSSEDFALSSSRRTSSFYGSGYRSPQRQIGEYYHESGYPRFYSGANYESSQPGLYDEGSKYEYPTEQPFAFPGGLGVSLLEALTSISQYDDLKCVPRILCEVATGVLPGSSRYKQNFVGGNSLISLLTALPIDDSSPLLTFGKSALTGYTNRGNPSVCYREYPRCPRSNGELVTYLNNHNGGFFRLFKNVRGYGKNNNRGGKREPALAPAGLSNSESDRTGTGELKFDSPPPPPSTTGQHNRESTKSFFPNREKLNDKVAFPPDPLQGEQSLNRVSKSLSGYQASFNDFPNPPSFFPQQQDRKEAESNFLFMNPGQVNHEGGRSQSSRTMEVAKPRLYFPEDATNETTSMFTFPDGQKVRINVAFSKLFAEGYKKGLRRSFGNDHAPQPVNFEGFSMINLAELFQNDKARPADLQVVHPCDMICHDSKGTPVQFSQILPHSGALSTLMAPERPILDLTNSVPCEVICIDRRGERRQLSTFLNQVLRINSDRPPETPSYQGSKF